MLFFFEGKCTNETEFNWRHLKMLLIFVINYCGYNNKFYYKIVVLLKSFSIEIHNTGGSILTTYYIVDNTNIDNR